MKPRKMRDGVYWVGVVDWQRRLFDDLIPLPDGTSYNAYLVVGSEKTALIDTVDPSVAPLLSDHLAQLNVKRLDYIVANHAEQDHSGALPRIAAEHPEATILTTPRGKKMLIDLLLLPGDRIATVEDGEKLSLGNRTLEFVHTPWVHWPETMVTYLQEDRILFSCDFFASHLATADLYVVDEVTTCEAAKRYYAEIMMPYRHVIQKNLEKIRQLDVATIAASHGPIYDPPHCILESYQRWVGDEPGNVVVLAYISMHGSTRKMIDYLIGALVELGVTVRPFDLVATDLGKLAIALVDAATVVVGSPTVLGGAHPTVAYAASLIGALRPKLRCAAIVGSYGWAAGKTIEQLAGMLSALKVEMLDPVVATGQPREADFAALDRLAATIAAKHRQYKLVGSGRQAAP